MTINSSKVVTYALTGAGGTGLVQSSKLVVYAWMEPGTEAGGTPPASGRAFGYAQVLRPPE